MKYYWSCAYNSGSYWFWKTEDEKQFLKLASKVYCGKAFDFGETTVGSYKRAEKHKRTKS